MTSPPITYWPWALVVAWPTCPPEMVSAMTVMPARDLVDALSVTVPPISPPSTSAPLTPVVVCPVVTANAVAVASVLWPL